MKKRKTIPVYIDSETGTIYIQDKRTGLMKGRKRVRGRGDGTKVLRADGRGHRIIKRIKKKRSKRYRKGQIFGRVPRGLARASLTTRRRVASLGGKSRKRK